MVLFGSKLEPEYADIYERWRSSPGPESNAEMLRAISPVVERAVQTHVGGYDDPLTRSRARQMALQSLQSYDPTKARLSTHLYNQLQGLKRYAAKRSQVISVPERVALDRRAIQDAESELEMELSRAPTDSELADRLGIPMSRINRARTYKPPMAEGFLASLETDDGDGGLNPAVQSRERGPSVWQQLVYDDLSAVDRKIMEWTLGLHGHRRLSNQDIARRLRLTPGAVSQRKARIQQLLDQESDISPF